MVICSKPMKVSQFSWVDSISFVELLTLSRLSHDLSKLIFPRKMSFSLAHHVLLCTWSPSMLKVDSKEGELGLVKQLWLEVVKMGDEVTILEGGEFLRVAPETSSIKSAASNTWLVASKRLWISTWAMLIFKASAASSSSRLVFLVQVAPADSFNTGRCCCCCLQCFCQVWSRKTKKITVLGGSHRWSSSWALW